jgi:hypothetical protein
MHLAIFGDDYCLYATEHKEDHFLRKLQRGLNSMAEWSKRWNIKINKKRRMKSKSQHIKKIETKAFGAFIRTYTIFKSENLSAKLN